MKSSAIKRHAHMVNDPLRTRPLVEAIRTTVKKNDAVLDIGTGTGVLAVVAAKAGARSVIAVDCDEEALEIARRMAKAQGVADRITFVQGLSYELSFPQKHIDVVICETVGSFGYDENILTSIADAKKRLLKKGGRIIPCRLELWGAPLSSLPKPLPENEIARIEKSSIMGAPRLIHSTDFAKPFKTNVHAKCEFGILKNGILKGFAVWPKVFWNKKFTTDASPFERPTHWKQGILPVEPQDVKKGGRIKLEILFTPHPDDTEKMTERLWRARKSA